MEMLDQFPELWGSWQLQLETLGLQVFLYYVDFLYSHKKLYYYLG